jgi:hypothetical protein
MKRFVNLSQFKTRLSTTESPFKVVEVVGAIPKALQNARVYPSCFVFRGKNNDKNQGLPLGTRTNENTIHILTAHQIYNDAYGGKHLDIIDERREWVIDQLHEWLPDSSAVQQVQHVKYVGGDTQSIGDVIAWYVDLFNCEVRY